MGGHIKNGPRQCVENKTSRDFVSLQKKAAVFRRALVKLQSNDQWTLSQSSYGVTTFIEKRWMVR